MIHLLAVILLAVGALASSGCPPKRQIFPCQCRMHSMKTIECNDVSLDSVLTALGGNNTQTLPFLHLTNLQSFSLPTRALGNLAVRRLHLSGSSIRRIEKDAFYGQTALEFLVLSDDKLVAVPTEALQPLTSLTTLNLADNFLWTIPDKSLANLDGLRFLSLHHNAISEIGKDAFPKNLDTLVLSQNFLSTFNGSLQSLEHLEELYASNNRLTSVKGEFDGNVHLRILNLDRNKISDISDSFTSLASIRHLSLADNFIQDVGNALVGLNKLTFLNMSRNFIAELHWRIFENLKDLQVLDLSRNFLTAICPAIKPLMFLRELRLSKLGLKRLEPDCFYNMKNLISLDLSLNQLSSSDAVSGYPLPSLVHLRLDNNRLSGLKYGMKYAKNLMYLDISFNDFRSTEDLRFSYNKILSILKIEGNVWMCDEQNLSILRDLEQRGVEIQGLPRCWYQRG